MARRVCRRVVRDRRLRVPLVLGAALEVGDHQVVQLGLTVAVAVLVLGAVVVPHNRRAPESLTEVFKKCAIPEGLNKQNGYTSLHEVAKSKAAVESRREQPIETHD